MKFIEEYISAHKPDIKEHLARWQKFGNSLCEKVHHAAHGTTPDLWEKQRLVAPEQYWERGRALSYLGEYARAAEVYLRGTVAFPNDAYSWHYLGYNLMRAEGDPAAIEAAYRRAVALDSTNAWWNGRLVQHLIAKRHFAVAASEWRASVQRVDPDGERLRESDWLGEQLHQHVADAWFKAGQVQKAEEVLQAIPSRITERSESLRALQQKLAAERQTGAADPNVEAKEEAKALLASLYELAEREQVHEAMKEAFKTGDRWIAENALVACREALALADLARLGDKLAVALLSVLLPVRAELSDEFAEYYGRVKRKLDEERHGESESLLRGLAPV